MKYKGILLLLGGLIFGMLLGAVIILSSPGQARTGSRQIPPTVGSPVEDFELQALNGGFIRLSELQNKPVVINFWATWCAPCREEMPLLGRFADEYSGEVVVLGVNYAETEKVVQKFLEENQVDFPILLDEIGLVNDLYYVRNYPTTFFIDAEGVLRAQHIGMLTEDVLARYLALIGIE